VPRQTHVAAGILLDSAGRVLVTERIGDHSFAGLWEFPGGKIEDGEESVSALNRELGEELGIEIVDQSLFMQIEHEYPGRSVSIDFYLIRHWRNMPEGRDGQALMWVLPKELAEDLLLPADAPVIEALRMLGRTSASH
jgi:8-oxo-dGTP diphosphatase